MPPLVEIKRTNYSNSERSGQFLKPNAFLTYSWRFCRSNIIEQLEFKLEIGKKWDLETCRKVRKNYAYRKKSAKEIQKPFLLQIDQF